MVAAAAVEATAAAAEPAGALHRAATHHKEDDRSTTNRAMEDKSKDREVARAVVNGRCHTKPHVYIWSHSNTHHARYLKFPGLDNWTKEDAPVWNYSRDCLYSPRPLSSCFNRAGAGDSMSFCDSSMSL
jgi:hypothetical protein